MVNRIGFGLDLFGLGSHHLLELIPIGLVFFSQTDLFDDFTHDVEKLTDLYVNLNLWAFEKTGRPCGSKFCPMPLSTRDDRP